MGLVSAAGLLSARNSIFAQSLEQSSKPRVIVVGAGFAGLACAYELTSAGYDVKVFEARKRVGGRVLSLKNLIPGKNVEGGGELLGSNHPHVLAYAAKFGFKFLDITEEYATPPMILNGTRLTEQEVHEIESECESAYTAMTQNARLVDAAEPSMTADGRRLDQRSTAEWITNLEISKLAKKLLTLQFTVDNAVATQRQSYLGNLAQVKGGGLERYWTDTELYRLKGGNQQFALRLASELGNQRIKLDCPIREIIATNTAMVAIDAGGDRYEADDIVLATPPSTWFKIQFNPELPRTLAPQMGANVKHLSVIKEPFWRNIQCSPDATTDGDIGQTWHGTDGQSDAGLVALVAFSGGPAAEAVHHRAVVDRKPAYTKAFEELFPGYTQHFIKGQMMDWIADPWTQAGYSFPAPGQVTTIGPILHGGLDRLHFAGEHCCYQFVGYMEGALHSGASLAKRITQRDGM
jgi:monoamine oxidase